jgi:glucose-1-phosphate adenylyltransferase
MDRVSAIILAGGKGTRLMPLTDTQAKPAVPFAGTSRLIDIPICACLETGVSEIFVLTQYRSESIEKHLKRTYPICPQIRTISSKELGVTFEGTADAVRKIRSHVYKSTSDYILILAGDQIHDFDFAQFYSFSVTQNADLAIAAIPVCRSSAKRLGVLQMDENRRIVRFAEKPKSDILLDQLVSPSPDLPELPYLGSMGIYLFKKEALLNLLDKDPREDFGKHLIPSQIKKSPSYCYVHTGYWEDIGTIGTFYKANIDLVKKAGKCLIDRSANIKNALIKGSILGKNAALSSGCQIKDSIIVGPNVTLGKNCKIEKTIIDENAFIGHGVILTNQNQLENYEDKNICIRDGIIVVKRGAKLPNGYTL